MIDRNLPILFLVCFFCVSVPAQSLAASRKETSKRLLKAGQCQAPLTSAEKNIATRFEIGLQEYGRDVGAIGTMEDSAKDTKPNVVATPATDVEGVSQRSEPFVKRVEKLVRKGNLDAAFQLISKQLEEVSKDDPNFFFLNLYAGEFVVLRRNMLINELTEKLHKRGDFSSLSSFGTEFAGHLPQHEKPNKEALKYLLAAWDHIYLVSDKDHEMAVTRLTDAFFALVKPYISHTLFGINSDKILNTWLPSLDTASILLNQMPVGKIFLEGHTDNTGSMEDNLVLSKRRAESVKSYLVSKGIREDFITADGKGETSPIASNDTPEGRAENRRVEIVLSIRFPTH